VARGDACWGGCASRCVFIHCSLSLLYRVSPSSPRRSASHSVLLVALGGRVLARKSIGVAIDSPCACEHNNPNSLDARLFPSVVLAVAPAVAMDEASFLSIDIYGDIDTVIHLAG